MVDRWLWTQVEDMGPGPRSASAMSWDPVASQIVLFGGLTGPSPDLANPTPAPVRGLSDTWVWDGSLWAQVQDSGPTGRGETCLTPLPGTGVLLFGGRYGAGVMADTWMWNGADWTQLDDDGPAGAGWAMAYDPVQKTTVLTGTAMSAKRPTWNWDGARWSQVYDMTPQTEMPHMAWDQLSSELLLCGRQPGTGRFMTFVWTQTMWVQLSDMGPADAVVALLSSPKGIVARTGEGTWLWDRQARRWTQVQNMGGRFDEAPSAAWDDARSVGVLYDGSLGKTWTLSPPTA